MQFTRSQYGRGWCVKVFRGWQWDQFIAADHRATWSGAVRLFVAGNGGVKKMETALQARQKAWMERTMSSNRSKKRKANPDTEVAPKRRRVLRRPSPAAPQVRDDTPSDAGTAPGAAPCLGVREFPEL